MDDFIKIWPNHISNEVCQELINRFEEVLADPSLASSVDENKLPIWRQDFVSYIDSKEFNKPSLCKLISDNLNQCINEYTKCYPHITNSGFILNNDFRFKIQKTMPLGGFHVWHSERSVENFDRYLVWMIYLNDMPDGEAETEFMYQCKRVKPTRGTVLIWPADFTHLHRGLTVYTQPKYILTGWYTVNLKLSRLNKATKL